MVFVLGRFRSFFKMRNFFLQVGILFQTINYTLLIGHKSHHSIVNKHEFRRIFFIFFRRYIAELLQRQPINYLKRKGLPLYSKFYTHLANIRYVRGYRLKEHEVWKGISLFCFSKNSMVTIHHYTHSRFFKKT